MQNLKIPSLRWWIAGTLALASVLNYLDRTALGVASAQIKDELHLTNDQYGQVVNAFLIAYTLSYALGGWTVDRIGTRWGYLITLTGWSLANMAHSLARTMAELAGFRFLLGLGEATFFPTALRGVTEWFRPADRSKAVGLFLAGASLGAVLAPILVGWMMEPGRVGWRGAFVVTGALGFLLIPPWLVLYRSPDRHPALTDVEREYLAGQADARVEPERPWPLGRILAQRSAWVLMAERALTDAAWYLLLFWLLLYLQKGRGFTPQMVARIGWIPYAAADGGALFGGWLASRLIQRGVPLLKARTGAMFGFALLMPASLAAFYIPPDQPMLAVALFSVAAFGHMAWGANSLTLHSDLFPPASVATIMGISGAAGSLGGVAAGAIVGPLVDQVGSYLPVFVATTVLHPVSAVLVVVALWPRRAYNRS